MSGHTYEVSGLTTEQVTRAREKFGRNVLNFKKENTFFDTVKRVGKDPMMILLLVAASIYFISGKTGDGILLAVAIIFQASISFYQSTRSKNALEKLKAITRPDCKVIRNGKTAAIKSDELVVGDYLLVEEGGAIAADAEIIYSNDFSVNESILTGESFAVFKDETKEDKLICSGTTVASGMAIARITAIGNETRLGRIGKSLENISEEKTPLELQIANFVRLMVITGTIVFVIVWAFNYWNSHSLLTSLLQSLTLAMSILPEEIPVAFTTFMALGAWRLMKTGIVVKQMKTVETLGSATVICTDKTGTITENRMSLAKLYLLSADTIFKPDEELPAAGKELVSLAMWASEPVPFDPMEIALHHCYKSITPDDERANFKLVHEYPLGGKPPMMTHVFKDKNGNRIIAAKGAPEALMQVSALSTAEKERITAAVHLLAAEGYRVLGVGVSGFSGNDYPETQEELRFDFKGVVAFYDPPKVNMRQVLQEFYDAGIAVKIITGDNAATTTAIAKQIGFRNPERIISGDELMKLDADALKKCVNETAIFTRMFPEAKLKIINALRDSGHVVAMTGDGVNDGPALKAAHIGIAMGKKGTEIARQAASLVLLEDDLSEMVNAVAMGRKVYTNLKKAIQYIISIHIPIILTVFIPLVLGWIYPNIFSPIHIIFLEIIMGPTCSVIYENEPIEQNAMHRKPKALSATFFNWQELSVSIIQGLVITAGILFVYRFSVSNGYSETLTRTMTFTTLIAANIFLTLINRSFYYSILTTLRYRNNLVVLVILITMSFTGLVLYFKPLSALFKLEALHPEQLLLCAATGFVSVTWFEGIKWLKRKKILNSGIS